MARAALLLVSTVVIAVAFAQERTCYKRSNGDTSIETNGVWFACNNTQQISGGAQLCCLQGSECGTDALCHQPTSNGGSGWFVGGCTDPTYDDPVCRKSCTEDEDTWIQYNYTSQLWHCCGDSGCTGTPTSETFQAQPPELFSAVPSGPQASSSAAATESVATVSATPAPAPSEMSTGVKVGIGILAAVSAVAVVAAFAFFVLWRKARKAGAAFSPAGGEHGWKQHQGMQQEGLLYPGVQTPYSGQWASYGQRPPEEMGAGQRRASELAAGHGKPPELA